MNQQLNIEDWTDYYEQYFQEFNRLAVGEYSDLSYGNDRPNDTASSLESIIAYSNYILKKDTGINLLDAGAGASSWMFNLFFNNVLSIDPNKRYAELVKKVCAKNGKEHDIFWSDFNLSNSFRFHHIYYDYGSIERLPYLGLAINLALKSIYVDDTDDRECCKPYRDHVISLCEAKGLKWFDCIEAKDEHGRWGIIIEK